ncbi:MAG: zinc-dependent alcohol dehydrogenase family protein [Elusimicrobia bacterium]|nr:zinc-dependent alcohol dehydrogenase family protein [Elusimicrobiota bacterium]
MKAMVFESVGKPLRILDVSVPKHGPEQVFVKVSACGVCRTDLHIVQGDLQEPKKPLIPGHEVVGTVSAMGLDVQGFEIGHRVGIPWLGWACGHCPYCLNGQENLCDDARFTGYHFDGGYAEYAVVDYRYCFPIPESYGDAHAAPLLCAGLIGYRSYRKTGDAKKIGFYGFGASAHILIQVARFEGREVYAFTRPGDREGQAFALRLGAAWAGGSDEPPPEPLDSAILFAPVGALLPVALRALRKGGNVVCAGIHMSDIPSFPYKDLWGEKSVQSVSNLTRADAREFLGLAGRFPIRTEVTPYPLAEANKALDDFGHGRIKGAAVLVMESPTPTGTAVF